LTGSHFVVCGDNPLAYRIARELTGRYEQDVVVILADKLRNHGPQIAALPGVTVREYAELTSEAFTDADVASARAMALVGPDDLANFHAALRAQELNPDLRLVVAAYNRRLGDHITGFFRDCTVLSRSQLAAPALVAAALGEIAPSHVRLSGRTLYVARRDDGVTRRVLCGLAVPDDPDGATQLIAPEDLNGGADLVLAVADGTPRDPLARQRHPVRGALRMTRRLLRNKFGVIFGVLVAAALAGFILLATAGHAPGDVLYLGIMDMTGSALTSTANAGPEKVAQVLLTADGMALLPLMTAIIVGARLTGRIRREPRARGGHVIVVGGGDVGTRVAGGLHDLGFDVVLIDQNPAARGVAFARHLGLPVVLGDAPSERVLRRAGVDSAIALISATSNDIVNLETAMQARAMRGDDLRIVLRLFDDDLARRVSENLGNVVSRSVSYLAAPAFAVAMLEHKVLRTIPVGRHVLVIADVRVEPGSDIAGRPLADLERDRLSRVLALAERGTPRFDWSPRRDRCLVAGDRLIVLATQAGLSTFLAGNRPQVSTPGLSAYLFRQISTSRYRRDLNLLRGMSCDLDTRSRLSLCALPPQFFRARLPIATELPQGYAMSGMYSIPGDSPPGSWSSSEATI
jgi:Trk K+ transport system NAD-binding subunit